ncbi:MAG TPA: glutathione S-transferase family protein [Myxococcota bacterium]|nr:glutathione S-transferase family protein [Myxococcota bacterium]
MSAKFRIFGSEMSPYSVKVRSYFRYKGIAHEWIVRGPANQAEYAKHAKLPLIPLVVTPDEKGLQDSTPILEALEEKFPQPAIHPSEPVLAFLSALLEEWGDEWGNKWMFHLRWARPADQDSAAERIARDMTGGASGDALAKAASAVKERMVPRVWFVGSNAQTAPQIEQSYQETLALLDAHLASRPYLLGMRPGFADFGVWAQLYECWTDPTPGAWMRERAPRVAAYVKRMLDPKAHGSFESWAALEPTLAPILSQQVAALFLPWSDANARAIAENAEELAVELASGKWTQKPQKYHARSLAALRTRYAAARSPALDELLAKLGCAKWLVA